MSKELKESIRKMNHQIKNINKDINTIKQNQIKILQFKSIITEIKMH